MSSSSSSSVAMPLPGRRRDATRATGHAAQGPAPAGRYLAALGTLVTAISAGGGCGNEDHGRSGTASTTTATAATTTEVATAAPTATVTPSASPSARRTPYAGPTGTVVGRVTIKGDPAPKTNFRYPSGCEGAVATYGRLFRTGAEGGLADALVAVTEYGNHYVPPARPAVPLTITNCAYSQRTVVMTDGQHLTVENDMTIEQFLPHLDGARQPATIVAIPGGAPIKVFSRGISRYWLRDQMGRQHMVAHVFHLPYATADVTSLDGSFRIEGIPAGRTVKVSAMLPQLKNMNAVTRSLEVAPDRENTIDLELTFDAERDTPADGHGGTKPRGGPTAPTAPTATGSGDPGPTPPAPASSK
ncbi:MAG: hypothetical protein AAGN82_22635 [Myxococcota bacterium]